MQLLVHATPLASLHAVALDTETTGLDLRVARVIELAGVRIDGTSIAETMFSELIACPIPVPASSSAVHGVTDADLAGAPPFADVWERFRATFGDRVWIGYAIGFDAAVLRKACSDAGLPWTDPPTLDIRLLAQALAPALPDFSLEALAGWLGVTIDKRHRAAADAEIAARMYVALAPKLRAKGVYTLGDALRVCARLSEGSAWPIAAPALAEGDPGAERVDAYPYRHLTRDLMSRPPAFAPSNMTLMHAIRTMAERRMSSLYVGEPDAPAAHVGILTERDAMRAVARDGAAALDRMIGDYATRALVTIAEDAFVYRAIGRMARRNIRHLAVTDAQGRISGALSARDLLRLRASAAVELGDDLKQSPDVAALGRAWAKLPAVVAVLHAEGMPAREIAAIIAAELRAASASAAALAEAALIAEGRGGAPTAYAVLALGSAGRGESLLAMDQDNALVFADGEPGGPEDRWFEAFGHRMSAILDEIGVPFCKGGVMIQTPEFRGSLETWRTRVRRWLTRSNPADLLAVDIVFDMRAIHGDVALAEALRGFAWGAARGEKAFLKLLAANGEAMENPFGLFGGWKLGPDERVDMKNVGLRAIVTAARVLAINGGHPLHSTHDRLAALAARTGKSDYMDLDATHAAALEGILAQQLADLRAGKKLSNRVAPPSLDRKRQSQLKTGLAQLSAVPTLVRDALTEPSR